jgi:sodium-dependent dicarboxylate transporter 2/3/5
MSKAEEAFERGRRRLGWVAGPVVMLLVWVIPVPGLNEQAHRMLAVMALVGIWWLSEALPLAVTALVGPAICVVLGIASARDALRPFSDPVIFLFLGGFLLAEAMVKHGLNRRLALGVLALPWVGRHRMGLYAGFGVLTAGLSAWVSNTATAAMMLPIAVAVLREMGSREAPDGVRGTQWEWRDDPRALGLILVTAFAASIGGLATPIGTPPNILGVGMIDRMLGVRLTFFDWMRFGLPAAALLTLVLVVRLYRVTGRVGGGEGAGWGLGWVAGERSRLGTWTRAQLQVAVVFLGAVMGWVLPGCLALVLGREAPLTLWWQTRLPEGVVALLAASLLFLLPAGGGREGRNLEWSDAARIDWGTILLFGGGMAMGEMMFATGLAQWMGEALAGGLPIRSVFTLTLLFTLVGVVVSEATSNTASATMIIPLAIAVAQGAEVDPLRPALGACLGCSLGFMLPVSTPPNALAYGTGAVPLLKMIRHGCWLDVVGAAIVLACVLTLAP